MSPWSAVCSPGVHLSICINWDRLLSYFTEAPLNSLVVQEPSSYITNLLIYFNVIVPSNEYIRQQQDASMLVSRIPYNFNIFSDIRE